MSSASGHKDLYILLLIPAIVWGKSHSPNLPKQASTLGCLDALRLIAVVGLAGCLRRAYAVGTPRMTCRAAGFRILSRAMKKWTTAANVVVLSVLISALAIAQQTHKQYEPANAPGAGQKLLAQFAGDWDVVKSFFPTNGKPIVTKGTCKQYMIQDGKFLQSDFVFFNPDGTKSTGTGISGFDSKTNRFTTVWYDSRQTTMSIRQSDGTFDGKNIVLWATPLETEHPGRKTVARAHLEEDGRVLLHRHFLIDEGEERMIIELRMTRK